MTAERGDQSMHAGQSEARPSRAFRGEERVEDLADDVVGDTRTVIGHHEQHPVALWCAGRNGAWAAGGRDADLAAMRHGVA